MALATKKKTSPEQLNILVDFVAEHRVLVHGKTKPGEAENNLVENLWDELTQLLNSCGSGPIKTNLQWKKTFIDWKCNTRKKARACMVSQTTTGGGEQEEKKLNSMEEKLMAILSWITVTGVGEVEEVGLEEESTPEILPSTSAAMSSSLSNITNTPKKSSAVEPSFKKRKLCTGNSVYIPNHNFNMHQVVTGTRTNLQQTAEAFATGQTETRQMLQMLLNASTPEAVQLREKELEVQHREIEFKEAELEVRIMEAHNKKKELEIKEKEMELRKK